MLGLKGSFIGFSFDGQHSSRLGISRIFSSDRLEIPICPSTKEVSVDLPGQDGIMFLDSYQAGREIRVSFAFSELTEEQLQKLKQLFNKKGLFKLILDEDPYKVWLVRPTNQIILSNLAYSIDGKRVYGGQGEIIFKSPNVYATSRYSYREDFVIEKIQEWIDENVNAYYGEGGVDGSTVIYPATLIYPLTESDEFWGKIQGEQTGFLAWLEESDLLTDVEGDLEGVNSVVQVFSVHSNYVNLQEWITACRLPSIETFGSYKDGSYRLFNAGDAEMPFRLTYEVGQLLEEDVVVSCGAKSFIIDHTAFYGLDSQDNIIIDTHRKKVFLERSNGGDSLRLYNFAIDGDLFCIPLGENYLSVSKEPKSLEYHYLYI